MNSLRHSVRSLINRQAATNKLNGHQIRKGTGDVLKDLAHAQRFTESIQDQFGGQLGLEIDFVDRALRVASAEIKQLRIRLAKKGQTV